MLLSEVPSVFGHEFCGIEMATGRRVVAANSGQCGECAAASAATSRCASACCRSSTARTPSCSSCRSESRASTSCRSARPGAGDRRAGRAARLLHPRRPARRDHGGTDRRGARRRADRADALCVHRGRGREAGARRRAPGAPRPRAGVRRSRRQRTERRRGDRGDRLREGLGRRGRARPSRRHRRSLQRPSGPERGPARRVPDPLPGADRARIVPPHAARRPGGARVPRQRRASVGQAADARSGSTACRPCSPIRRATT